jgi:hypothetical protein
MKSKFFKRLIPMVLGGVAMLVLAMPITASAHEWNNHNNGFHNNGFRNNGFHNGWVHRGGDDFGAYRWNDHDRDDFHRGWGDHDRDDYGYAPRAYYPNAYYTPQPAMPFYGAPGYANGYGACGNLTRLQNVYRYDRRTGHPAAANDVARRMQNCGGGVYGQNGFYGQNGYYGQNSVFGPVGSMFGLW